MKNKLLRLAELIQDDCPENILPAFKSSKPPSLDQYINLISSAISSHQQRATTLWLKAGKKRSEEERRASAQAELASFMFAYLIGEAKDHAEGAIEAMQTLGRQGEVDLITSLAGR